MSSTFYRILRIPGAEYISSCLCPLRNNNIQGDIFAQHSASDQVAEVKMILAPLARRDIAIARCLGLNYEQHAKESNLLVPIYPLHIHKPITPINLPRDAILISAMAQEGEGLDHEYELVIITGELAKNVPERRALDIVLGYIIRNDVSRCEVVTGRLIVLRVNGHWGKWALLGPGIVSTRLIHNLNELHIWTKLNRELVQSMKWTKDMIFGYFLDLFQGTILKLKFSHGAQGVGMGQKPAF
ncbi:hypothetical protein BDV25DRAFT_134745 [Aspergillus avenaceus]|uniref:Fumarylacetoacetase-like C-terminal domain-containing protein n=1 Tax=Aspergillus avenaceus TaxID=36643 RepID=A0A5N6TDB8_ASPAV|nr:hypothetical protein BDV25DRAFT_134745 [Aspergillus avenaceus]